MENLSNENTIQTRNLEHFETHKWTPISQTALIDCRRCDNCDTLTYRVAHGFMYYQPHEQFTTKIEPTCYRLNSKPKKKKT